MSKRCPTGKWLVNGHCVKKNELPSIVVPIPIYRLDEIKEHQNDDAIVIKKGRTEGIIYPKKYGDKWWKKASKTDILRVTSW